jgi:hypothetical protein
MQIAVTVAASSMALVREQERSVQKHEYPPKLVGVPTA